MEPLSLVDAINGVPVGSVCVPSLATALDRCHGVWWATPRSRAIWPPASRASCWESPH